MRIGFIGPGAMGRRMAANLQRAGHEVQAHCAGRGGPKGAEAAKLALWVGGEQGIFDRFRPLLQSIADQPLYVGPIGAASSRWRCSARCASRTRM